MKRLDIDLKSHVTKNLDLVIIAGEHSGDQNAAAMLKEAKILYPSLKVAVFGGEALRAAGADLILDMTKFSVVGLWEVLVRYFFFSKLFFTVLGWIKNNKPRVVCLVDYPGFNIRLAQALFDQKLSNKSGGPIKVVYYISPQVWAWKECRKRQMARLIDKLATILPFEKELFGNELDVKFVGHPFVENGYVSHITYNSSGPILLLPGSRNSSVKKIYPMLLKIFSEISKSEPIRMAATVYPNEEILATLRKILKKHHPELLNKIVFVSDGTSIEASAAVMSSGTMSLKCCLAGVPGAIVYKTNPITYTIGKALIKIKWLGLANILLKKCVWREFLQNRLRPKSVAKYILQCLDNEKIQQEFAEASVCLKTILSANKDLTAAQWLFEAIQ